jgi:hypothetical protein
MCFSFPKTEQKDPSHFLDYSFTWNCQLIIDSVPNNFTVEWVAHLLRNREARASILVQISDLLICFCGYRQILKANYDNFLSYCL